MKKKFKLSVLVFLFLIFLCSINIQAFQSIYNDLDWGKYILMDTMTKTRDMETSGEILGLYETIDPNTLESTSGSNNIDVHMIKNVEYGTMAILAVSQYGKQPLSDDETELKTSRYITNGEGLSTTTGNKSGIYLVYGGEVNTATVHGRMLTEIARKYVNEYTSSLDSAITGDATKETRYWQNSIGTYWTNESIDTLVRNVSGGGFFGWGRNYYYDTFKTFSYACIVNGEGI